MTANHTPEIPYNRDATAMPAVPQTAEDARAAITALAQTIGLAFHPDNAPEDYIDVLTGEALFTAEQEDRLEAILDHAFYFIGDEVYDIAVAAIEGAAGSPAGVIEEDPNDDLLILTKRLMPEWVIETINTGGGCTAVQATHRTADIPFHLLITGGSDETEATADLTRGAVVMAESREHGAPIAWDNGDTAVEFVDDEAPEVIAAAIAAAARAILARAEDEGLS